uniref:Mitogen-activated protein kinase 8 interacting protein 2 n=1 Tax=Poecilia formosa TaxID=48698 RepID=A0A096M2H7_POEFO
MADRAEMFSLSTFHSLSPPGCRPSHDISLEEFDDEDLSEITDDCGIGLNYDSDPYEKDSLILEKSDMHHPVCSFQDDFQEFEMIDDEDEDEEDEEDEEEEVDPDAPPSPSASPPPSPTLGTLKSRPTTLNLTTAVSQDSLNNNSSLSPKKGSWQDSLRNPTSQGELITLSVKHLMEIVLLYKAKHSEYAPPLRHGGQQTGKARICYHSSRRSEAPDQSIHSDTQTVSAVEPAANDSTSPSSDPGIADMNQQGYVTSDQDKDLSSPGSDSDVEGELEAAFTCGGPVVSNMISSISETELDLTSDESSSGRSSHLTNSIEEASSPTSDQELDPDTELEQDSGIVGLKTSLLLGQRDPIKPMVLEIEPDHGLESFKRSFYLPVGPRLMPCADEYDETSEGESESESEDDLSENSDSPWLLSNLVNRMISEGSYPISCPEECFRRKASVSDTISPSSDIGDGDDFNDETQDKKAEIERSQEREKEGKGYRKEMLEPGASSHLYMSNPTADTISPLILERCANLEEETTLYTNIDCDKNSTEKLSKNAGRPEDEEPNNDLMMEGRRDLDSPSLSESVITLERITEVKNSLTLDIPTAQTNRCFSLTYSTDNDEEEDDGDSYSFMGSMRNQSVHNHPLPDHDLPLCEKDLILRQSNEDDGLAYDSMKYTLVVDENTTLELVSLRRCTSVLSDDSELSTLCDEEPLETGKVGYRHDNEGIRPELLSSSEDSSPEADLPFSKKFLNVFVNSTSHSSSTESFGLFSCTINGEERDQTHRAVYRFIPRHEDELELDVDDPLYVEEEEDDYWYRGYNMRTGEKGIFPAFYAHEVIGQSKELLSLKRNPGWIETFNVQFLGSVEVPYHQGNGILCAAMQKIAMSRKRTVHVRPPSLCELEISLQGVKLIMTFSSHPQYDRCSHFFQMKNISFCGCHPRNNCYFGFITKHPMLNRFACHVFVSQESMRPVAECVGRAFQEYYQEHLEYACPTEDIYLE